MFTVLWILWGVAFAVIEAVAVMNDKKDDTLSAHLREWFRTDRKMGRWVWVIVSGVFFAWFGIHIGFEGSL